MKFIVTKIMTATGMPCSSKTVNVENFPKTKEDFDSRVSAMMKVLDSLNRNLSKTPMYSSMSNGFLFTEIQYPNVYIW